MVRALRQRADRMNPLLEHRQKLVEEAQRQLAEQERWVAACRAALQELEASQRALALHLAAIVGRAVEPAVLAGAASYESWLARRRQEQEEALERAKRQAEAARAALVAQRREAKKIEVVRARWLNAALQVERKTEANLLDEIGTVRAAYRARASDEAV